MAITVDISLPLIKGFPQLLSNRGWDVHLVCSPGPALSRYSEIAVGNLHSISMMREPSPLRDLKSLLTWIHLLRTVVPDIVFLGTPKASLLGMIAATIARVPTRVYLLRGLRLETSAGFRRQVLTALERLTVRCATQVVSVGPSLRERAVALGIVPEHKILILGAGSSNGVDTEQYDLSRFQPPYLDSLRRRLSLNADLPTIGFVGRLTRDKGLFDLAEAAKILAQRGLSFQLLVVGDADGGSGRSTVEALRGLDLPVVLVGRVSDPAPYYALMTVFCLPSLREGFANVVIEASSMGVPVIVSDATGMLDTVDDGTTGLSTPVGNPVQLANTLEQLLHDSDLAKALGNNGRKWVRANFSRPAVQRRYAEYLENLVRIL